MAGLNCVWPGYARLIWTLGLRTGSGQLQNFYSGTQAEEVMTFWGMLISWQREEDFKTWNKLAMPCMVSDWSWHIITSAYLPLSQVSHKTYSPIHWIQEGHSAEEALQRQGEKEEL